MMRVDPGFRVPAVGWRGRGWLQLWVAPRVKWRSKDDMADCLEFGSRHRVNVDWCPESRVVVGSVVVGGYSQGTGGRRGKAGV